MPAAGARHPATGTARAVQSAAGGPPTLGKAAQGLPSVPAGRPSAFKAFRVPGVQSSRPKGDGADCTAEASSPPPEGSCHFVPRQEGRQSFHVVRATTIEKNPISRQTEEKSKGATLIGSQHPQRAAQHRVLGTPVLRASPLDRDFKPQFDDPKAKRPLVSLSISPPTIAGGPGSGGP